MRNIFLYGFLNQCFDQIAKTADSFYVVFIRIDKTLYLLIMLWASIYTARQYIFVNQDKSEQDPSAAGDLHRISINDVLLQKYSEMQEEFEYNLHYGSNFRRTLEPYSSMALQQAVAFRRSTMNT